MPFPQSNGASFYLTNTRDTLPLVHAFLEPSCRTWQYVVIDPSTHHGVIIDPVCPQNDTSGSSPSDTTEDIIRLIESHGYFIDEIFETESSRHPKLTAAWSLRMQLSSIQGYPPQLCSNSSVSALHRQFARKYGAANGLRTTLSTQHEDKQSLVVGRMRVTVMHLPGFGSANRRAYLVGGALFGAHSIALPGVEDLRGEFEGPDPVLADAKDDDERRTLWTSMNRVLALPEDTHVYLEEYIDAAGMANCTTIDHCRAVNPYIGLSQNDFIIRRRGERKEHENESIAASNRSRKRTRQGKGSR